MFKQVSRQRADRQVVLAPGRLQAWAQERREWRRLAEVTMLADARHPPSNPHDRLRARLRAESLTRQALSGLPSAGLASLWVSGFPSISYAPRPMALNGLKIHNGQTFGRIDDQLDDAARLGSGILRQPGRVDLLWSVLADDIWTEVPASTRELYDLVVTDGHVERLAEMLVGLAERDLRVIFTFLTLGGGSGKTMDVPVWELDADGNRELEYEDVSSAQDGVLRLNWAHGHVGQTADGCAFDDVSADVADADEWKKHSLDLRSGYKVAWLGRIAWAAARLLLKAEVRVRATIDGFCLNDVVEGIEIFNEADVRNQYASAEFDAGTLAVFSGIDWGVAWARVAAMFRRTLSFRKAAVVSISEPLPLLLPGISSYNDVIENKNWRYKRWHLVGLAASAASVIRSDYTGEPDEWIAGVDYHWYHDREGEQLPIAYLPIEVEEIRDTLDVLGLSGAAITVIESGASATRDNSFVPGEVRGERARFQAEEVWRRLGTALSGADAAGWHSWMSLSGSDFSGDGLRVDSHTGEEPASLSTPRPSWAAYQRLCRQLGGVSGGRVVSPSCATRAEVSTLAPEDGLVILEFWRTSKLPDSYLVFIDPTSCLVRARVRVSSDVVELIRRVPTIPTLSRILNPGSEENLPTSFGFFPADEQVALPTSFTVERGGPPLLLRSRRAGAVRFGVFSTEVDSPCGAAARSPATPHSVEDPTALLHRHRERWDRLVVQGDLPWSTSRR